ncbi:MAG: DNA repair protein RecN [Bacteroides sp.]|nr:DNA repair protein RecN [Bacteroides sp.]
MLRSLFIQNYALIDKLDIDFENGFSVITGETGAGKSIILGAIGLLLGQRADVKAIRNGATKCVIEAHFDIASYQLQTLFDENEWEYEDECIIRRELSATGKSRAFVNDSPASLAQIKELGELLVDVHSQHQNLLLSNEGFQIKALDVIVHNEQLLTEYRSLYNEWKKAKQQLALLVEEADKNRADEDYYRYQVEQLENAHLVDGEQEELEEELDILNHAEEIKAQLYKVEQITMSDDMCLLQGLKECVNAMQALNDVYPDSSELSDRLESCYIELKDIAEEVATKNERIEFNPSRLEEVTDRLNLIYSLQQKYHANSISELLSLQEEFATKLSAISSSDETIQQLQKQVYKLFAEVVAKADCLSKQRKSASEVIEKQMCEQLALLGMPNVQFRVDFAKRKEPNLLGMDSVNFLFSANKNAPLQNISSVASGGEIARVMLTIKALIAKEVKLPTIIFDEIDTGVSGEIADRMATIMLEMGEANRQVISITHLPQIASKGKVHYKVFKQDSETETNSNIRRLTDEERINEVAQMLSGATLTEAALHNAKALLNYK